MPIYRRGPSYRVDVYVNGRRVRQTANTKKEAERLEKELIAQDVNGTFPTESVEDIAFRDFAPRYLAYSILNKAEKTSQEDAWRVNAHFLPFFGDRRLSQFDVRLIEQYKAKRNEDGVSGRTINVELQLLSVMFRYAVRVGYARTNPLEKVERLNHQIDFLTKENARL